MFPSVHIMFPLSLGVFSWAILCYYNEIEKRLMCTRDNKSLDPATEVAVEEFVQEFPSRCREGNYDLYVNFICIFVCIYALAKVAYMTERYLAKRTFYVLCPKTFDLETIRDFDENCGQTSQENFRMQIEAVEKLNPGLNYKLPATGYDRLEPAANTVLQSRDGLLESFGGFYKVSQNSGDVWPKYLAMQTIADKKLTSPWLDIRKKFSVPVMLSTEELQEIHGLI